MPKSTGRLTDCLADHEISGTIERTTMKFGRHLPRRSYTLDAH